MECAVREGRRGGVWSVWHAEEISCQAWAGNHTVPEGAVWGRCPTSERKPKILFNGIKSSSSAVIRPLLARIICPHHTGPMAGPHQGRNPRSKPLFASLCCSDFEPWRRGIRTTSSHKEPLDQTKSPGPSERGSTKAGAGAFSSMTSALPAAAMLSFLVQIPP